MPEHVQVVARHGAAAFFGSLPFALLLLATSLVLGGMRYDGHTGRVYVVDLPYARLFLSRSGDGETVAGSGAALSAFVTEQEMGANALLDRWTPFIHEASNRFGLPASWIRAVMRQESGGRTMMANGRPITSPTGAQGLMQVMPDTYEDARVAYGLGGNAFDPHDNIIAGASYLKTLYRKYGFPAMFVAYNDGPGNYEASLRGDHKLPKETQDYLASVTAHLAADAPHRHRGHRHTVRFAGGATAGRT